MEKALGEAYKGIKYKINYINRLGMKDRLHKAERFYFDLCDCGERTVRGQKEVKYQRSLSHQRGRFVTGYSIPALERL